MNLKKKFRIARRWWLTPVILAAQEAEIRRIMVQSQSRQISQKKTHHKNRTGSCSRYRPRVQTPIPFFLFVCLFYLSLLGIEPRAFSI
jgi:hypothetical protein